MVISPPLCRGKRGQNCYVTRAFLGHPNGKHEEKIRNAYITPAFSRAQKKAELLRNPYISRAPYAECGEEIRIG